MKILHVTSVYEGGVSRAIETIVRILPECTHLLLADGADLNNEKVSYESLDKLPNGLRHRIRSTRRMIETHRPDIIHAHSSWAGFYARIFPFGIPVVYQPHCFVMEDPTRSSSLRALYHAAEHFLSLRSDTTVTLSNREMELARRLLGHRLSDKKRIVLVPNAPSRIVQPGLTGPVERYKPEDSINVIMVGRVCSQKDPEFYTRVIDEIHRISTVAVGFRWIGDGDKDLRAKLADHGVEVTGWLDGAELNRQLTEADLYLHTARYEGFPLSVLDAANYDIPIVARSIPCFDGTALITAESPEDMARIAIGILADSVLRKKAIQCGRGLLETMNEDTQREALRALYLEDAEVLR